MDIVLVVKSIIGLVILLAILMFFFFYLPLEKKKVQQQKLAKRADEPQYTLDELLAVVKNKESSSLELQKALELVLKYYGHIPAKLGIRVHDDFYKYSEIILRLCRHPNTTKELILHFDKELRKKNPSYEKELNDALTKGITSRGM